jgi:hypothetical protein
VLPGATVRAGAHVGPHAVVGAATRSAGGPAPPGS